MSSYYAILGVPEHATPDEIRQAYRRLVLRTHPDRTPDPAAHQQYLAVNEAYETLGNPLRRQRYDAARRQPAPLAGAPAAAGAPRATRRAPPPAYRPRHTAYARPRYNLLPYRQPVRYLGRALLALALLVPLAYFGLRHSTTARLETISSRQPSAFTCTVNTTHGSFETPAAVPPATRQLRLRVSWLFPFVHAAWLPDGTPLPLVTDTASLFGFDGLLLGLAAGSQWRRLALPVRINLLLGAVIIGVMVLLLALLAA